METSQIEIVTTLGFSLHHHIGTPTIHSQISLQYGTKTLVKQALGNGMVDAAFAAIQAIMEEWKLFPGTLSFASLKIASEGIGSEARGKVDVKIIHTHEQVTTSAIASFQHTDIFFGATLAIVSALNQILHKLCTQPTPTPTA